MPIWCAHGYRTKRIVVTEETEAKTMETEIMTGLRKCLMIELIGLIETIARAVIIELTTANNGWLFGLASVCLIEGELFHLLAQAQSFQRDP